MAQNPDLAPEKLCDPDPRYGNETCTFSPLEVDLKQLETYCATKRHDSAASERWRDDFARSGEVQPDDNFVF